MDIEVRFHKDNEIEDKLIAFAVIVAKHKDDYIFCRHKDRSTYELPGGHREIGENIDYTAKRELMEETGAMDFAIKPISIYSVTKDDVTTYGKLFFAKVDSFSELNSEIEEIIFTKKMPINRTYPAIQPILFESVLKNEE